MIVEVLQMTENDFFNNFDFFGLEVFRNELIIVLLIICLIVLVFVGLIIVSMWKVYVKAGKPGWAAIVPFYNSWVLVEIAGLKWWFFLLLIFQNFYIYSGPSMRIQIGGLASIFASFCCSYNIAKKFGKSPVGYAFGLTFLPFIFYPTLAFSKSTVFDENVPVSPYGPIEEKN